MANLTGRDIVLKYRQGGVSTAIQGRHIRLALTQTVSLATIAHDDTATAKLRRIAAYFYQHIRTAKPNRRQDNAGLTTYTNDSEVLIMKAGTTAGGRSMSLTEVHGSEVAFWPDPESIVTGLLEAGKPRIVLESTPNGARGYFYELCMKALDGDNNYKLHFFPWWVQADYCIPLTEGETLSYSDDELALIDKHRLTPEQIKWRRSKIVDLNEMFTQEYPEDPYTCFKQAGMGYFGDTDHCFTAPFDAAYDPSHLYVAGLDFGQQEDYTALAVFDATTKTQVELLHIRRASWKEMRDEVRRVCKKWHVQILTAERNSVGSVNIEALHNEFAADKLKTTIGAFDMTHASKPPLMATYRTQLQENGLKLLDIPVQKHELRAAVSKQTTKGWTVESPRDSHGHGDTVVAGALACRAMTMGNNTISY